MPTCSHISPVFGSRQPTTISRTLMVVGSMTPANALTVVAAPWLSPGRRWPAYSRSCPVGDPGTT